jgi:RNA polymerase sigma-70 factor (ECF subfamily)
MPAFNESYLQALARQDSRAENDLISTFSRAIKVKLRTHLRSPQAVEDAYQETLLRVFTYFRVGKTLRTPASLPAFIHSVSGNVALEMVRARRKDSCSCDEIPEPVDAKADPERQTIASERRQTVQRLFRELSQKDQQLLRKICFEEEDRDEVCREFRVTRDYLRLLLHRARIRFKAIIQSEVEGCPPKGKGTSVAASSRLQYPTSGSRDSAGNSSSRALPFRRAYAG